MRRVIVAVFGTIAGLVGLLSFKTHAVSVAAPPAAVSTAGAGTGSGSSSSGAGSGSGGTGSGSGGTSAAASAGSSASARTVTATGDAVDTQYGPVQVKITVTNGKVTGATAVEYPQNDPRDAQINAYAIPILQRETVGVSSASIDMVSGATYTSQGYLQSLQSALDKAGL